MISKNSHTMLTWQQNEFFLLVWKLQSSTATRVNLHQYDLLWYEILRKRESRWSQTGMKVIQVSCKHPVMFTMLLIFSNKDEDINLFNVDNIGCSGCPVSWASDSCIKLSWQHFRNTQNVIIKYHSANTGVCAVKHYGNLSLQMPPISHLFFSQTVLLVLEKPKIDINSSLWYRLLSL